MCFAGNPVLEIIGKCQPRPRGGGGGGRGEVAQLVSAQPSVRKVPSSIPILEMVTKTNTKKSQNEMHEISGI